MLYLVSDKVMCGNLSSFIYIKNVMVTFTYVMMFEVRFIVELWAVL